MLPLLSFDVPGCVAGESDIGLPNCLSLLRLIRSIEADRWLWVWCQALMDVTLLVHGGRVSVREHHILSRFFFIDHGHEARLRGSKRCQQ